jgi:hypothetical protein
LTISVNVRSRASSFESSPRSRSRSLEREIAPNSGTISVARAGLVSIGALRA